MMDDAVGRTSAQRAGFTLANRCRSKISSKGNFCSAIIAEILGSWLKAFVNQLKGYDIEGDKPLDIVPSPKPLKLVLYGIRSHGNKALTYSECSF